MTTAGQADAVVVGGGVAGLVVARDLGKAGRRVLLLEASGRLGGEVQRHTVGGIDLDAGAESFATRGDTVATLATQLGLGSELVTPDGRGAWLVEADGGAFPLPATGILGIPGTAMAADVIRVIGTGGALRAQMDSLLPGTVGAKEQKLGPLVRRRMGAAVLDRLVTPVVMGVHSAHPDDLDVDRVAPGLRTQLVHQNSLARAVRELRSLAPAGSAVGGIRGGMVRLVDELVADLETYGVEVRLGIRVRSFDAVSVTTERSPGRDGSGSQGEAGSSERIPASAVVIALGARDAAALDSGGVPPSTGLITLATLVVRNEALDAGPRGTGVLIAPGQAAIRAKALTHATVKWAWLRERAEGRHVLRLSYDSPGITKATTETDLRAIALADASLVLGIPLDERSVEGFARVEWAAPHRSPAGAPGNPADGAIRVGGAVAGRGLAGVVAGARRAAAELIGADGG